MLGTQENLVTDDCDDTFETSPLFVLGVIASAFNTSPSTCDTGDR